MATVGAPTVVRLSPSVERVLWAVAAGADTATAVGLPAYVPGSLTVQVTGTFDSSTVAFQGSYDNVTFFALQDHQGNALSFTAVGGEPAQGAVRFLRFVTSGGGGSAAVVAIATYNTLRDS